MFVGLLLVKPDPIIHFPIYKSAIQNHRDHATEEVNRKETKTRHLWPVVVGAEYHSTGHR